MGSCITVFLHRPKHRTLGVAEGSQRKDVPFTVDVRGFETTIRNELRYS